MFKENQYLSEIFNLIVRRVVKNLIITKFSGDRICEPSKYDHEYVVKKSYIQKLGVQKNNLYEFRSTLNYFFKIDTSYCPLAFSIKNLIEDKNKILSETDIDFTDELNCLICVYNIFELFETEYNGLNRIYYDMINNLTFNKDKRESFTILEKKNIILNILLKCVDNFSIDQDLKEKARKMIINTAKFIRAQFFIEEKDDIENILRSLKFRLDNMIELENHDVLDKLMPDDALPDDFYTFQKEELVLKKSEIGNIVRTFHSSISDYIKESKFNSFSNSINNDDCKNTKDVSYDEDHQLKKPSKEKKSNRFIRIMKSIFCSCFVE
jgi:hypothetical protein